MTSPGVSARASRIVTILPSDFDIFSPSTVSTPLCTQWRAKGAPGQAHSLWAISFSWWGKTRSMPPPWMSTVSPR